MNSNVSKKETQKKKLYDKEVFGNNLKQYRKMRGYTQKELLSKFAEYDNITLDIRQYRDYENNKNDSDMSSQRLYVLSDILNVSMNDLVGKTFNPKSMNDIVFSSTGLTSKSIDTLKRKRKIHHRSTKIKLEYMKKNKNKNLVSDNIYNLDEVDALNYLIQNSNIISVFLENAKLAHIHILELQLTENDIKNKLKNITDKNEIKKLNSKLLEVKDKKKETENYYSFAIYNEVNKTLKKYIQYLRKTDTQHYITKN